MRYTWSIIIALRPLSCSRYRREIIQLGRY